MRDAETKAKLDKFGIKIIARAPVEFAATMKRDSEALENIVKESRAHAE